MNTRELHFRLATYHNDALHMKSTLRLEYHLINKKISERVVRRPKGAGRWPKAISSPTLVCVIEEIDDKLIITRGPAATDEHVTEAFRRFGNLNANAATTDFSDVIPSTVAGAIGTAVEQAVNEYAPQFNSFANEEDITGYLKGRLDNTMVDANGWHMRIRSWTYARNPKEAELGVDIGFLFEVRLGGRRVVKAIWIQAKRARSLPHNILELPRLRSQLRDMLNQTQEAYALIYTPAKAHLYSASAPQKELSIRSMIADAVLCKRGDRDPLTVALTAHSKVTVGMLVTDRNGPFGHRLP